MLTATGLTRRFGQRLAVDAISFDVNASEIVALLGPNGAGKTTTLRMLAGLIAPTSGMIVIDGVRLTRATGAALRRRIGFLPETPGLWDRLTVRENLSVYADLYSMAASASAIDRMLELLNLSDRAQTRTVELSKGSRQKVAIARALLHEPKVLLLDEPTAGLDPEVTRTVRQLLGRLRQSGCAIVVSTHNLDEAERIADRVALLQERLITVDTPASLRSRMTAGRLIVRVDGGERRALAVARRFDPKAEADGPLLSLALDGDGTPALVQALVAEGVRILEVRPDIPVLEDVYLHLITTPPSKATPS